MSNAVFVLGIGIPSKNVQVLKGQGLKEKLIWLNIFR